MKKIYWIGDIKNNTGPAIVNKEYYAFLKDKAIFCSTNNKIIRIIHFLFHFLFRKIIIISGFSKLNYILMQIGNFFNKKTVYLMHGYVKEEQKYLPQSNDEKIKLEYQFLKNVKLICCVSEKFSLYLKQQLPEFKDKITFVNNGVYPSKTIPINARQSSKYTILSVGGGLKIKNNLAICKALEKLNAPNIKFIVIGPLEQDGNKIQKYDFVDYYEKLSHEEVLTQMQSADLYIQNSYFETFGLAIVEALNAGCDLLISSTVGSLSILENTTPNDIITNNEDINEITKKIKAKIKKRGNISYNNNSCSWSSKSKELLKKVSE